MVTLRSTSGTIAAALALLVTGPALASEAVAAPALEPSSAEVPEPGTSAAETSTPTTEVAPEGESAIPEVQRPDAIEAEEPVAVEEPTETTESAENEPPAAATPPEAAVAEPPAEPAIDPSLLDAEPSDPLAPVATAPASPSAAATGRSPEERDAAIEQAFANLYRPADNPLRLNVAARVMFANISGQQRINGRMGGAAVDIGPSWNRVGVAATLTGWGGRVQLPADTGAEMNAMLGGGVSVGLGRLALQSRGFIDLRLGYDVFYGVVNQRSGAPPILQPQSEGQDIVATPAENLLPHGPRVRMDLGLLGAGNRRFFHGLGFSLGYQALVGSFKGDLPMANMLTLGLSYWMG